MTHPDARPYLFMLSGSFSFTLMAELAFVLTRQCDWQTVAVFRAALVAGFAAVLTRVVGAKFAVWPWRLWVRSLAGSCSMICTFFAFSRLPTADVLTLTNTFPLWVAVLSWPLYRRAPGLKMWLAILVGIIGVGLVEQPHLEAGNLGVFSALAAAFLTAIAMLGLHSLSDIDPWAIVTHFSAVATFVCLGAYFVGPTHVPLAHTLEMWIPLKLLLMGLTALIGQLFLTLAFGRGSPARVSVVGLTQIVFALIFDAWLWQREVNAVTIVGTLLVITPTAWLLVHAKAARKAVHSPESEPTSVRSPSLAETESPATIACQSKH